MSSEKLQRTMMAFVLSISWILYYNGSVEIASAILGFVIIMILVWAVTDFCPSLWFFSKVFKEQKEE